jgi:hypothetical protein
MAYNQSGKARPQSNSERVTIPKSSAEPVPMARNPPQRPVDADRRQPGKLTVGPSSVFSNVRTR